MSPKSPRECQDQQPLPPTHTQSNQPGTPQLNRTARSRILGWPSLAACKCARRENPEAHTPGHPRTQFRGPGSIPGQRTRFHVLQLRHSAAKHTHTRTNARTHTPRRTDSSVRAESTCNARDTGSVPGWRGVLRRKWQPSSGPAWEAHDRGTMHMQSMGFAKSQTLSS